MSNITRISIPELMDGRYFYIPSYQRGYRWTKTHVAAEPQFIYFLQGDYFAILTRKAYDLFICVKNYYLYNRYNVQSQHIAEVIGYRNLDRGDWAERGI